MAARTLTRAIAVAIALLTVLGLSPPCFASSAADDNKVWRALTEGEPRSAPPAAVRRSSASRGSTRAFPSELTLALVVGGVIAVILAVTALQARRRTAPPVAKVPREPEEGSAVEQLWRTHLRRKRPKGGNVV